MEDIYVIEHIKELCRQRGWTYYRLAKESNIPYSSLNTMMNKQHIPSMNNLIKICAGFRITLSQFFLGIDETTNEQQELLKVWNLLSQDSRNLAMTYIYGLARKNVPLFEKLEKD